MNVQLDKQTEALIARKVSEGEFDNAADLIKVAVVQMAERNDRLRHLKAELSVGRDQIERGETVEWTPELMDEIMANAVLRFEAGERPMRDGIH